MAWQDAALALAGVIGSSVAVFHGVLTQRLMVRAVEALFVADRRIAAPIRRLVPLLLQFSTFNWLLATNPAAEATFANQTLENVRCG